MNFFPNWMKTKKFPLKPEVEKMRERPFSSVPSCFVFQVSLFFYRMNYGEAKQGNYYHFFLHLSVTNTV